MQRRNMMNKRSKYKKIVIILGIVIVVSIIIPRTLIARLATKRYIKSKHSIEISEYSADYSITKVEYSPERNGYLVRYEGDLFSSMDNVLVSPRFFPIKVSELYVNK
jgi:hypothetical protein